MHLFTDSLIVHDNIVEVMSVRWTVYTLVLIGRVAWEG